MNRNHYVIVILSHSDLETYNEFYALNEKGKCLVSNYILIKFPLAAYLYLSIRHLIHLTGHREFDLLTLANVYLMCIHKVCFRAIILNKSINAF